MLAYPLDEAIALLTKRLHGSQESLTSITEDLEFLRDQITTMEVNTARVHNWDVKRRRERCVVHYDVHHQSSHTDKQSFFFQTLACRERRPEADMIALATCHAIHCLKCTSIVHCTTEQFPYPSPRFLAHVRVHTTVPEPVCTSMVTGTTGFWRIGTRRQCSFRKMGRSVRRTRPHRAGYMHASTCRAARRRGGHPAAFSVESLSSPPPSSQSLQALTLFSEHFDTPGGESVATSSSISFRV